MSKKASSAVAHLHPVPDNDQMVAVLLPASWMRKVDSSLEQLGQLLSSGTRRGPQPANAATDGEGKQEYMDHKEAAAFAGYHAKTIGRLVRSGRLKRYGLGGKRIKRTELEALMASLPKAETPDEVALAEATARLHAGEED